MRRVMMGLVLWFVGAGAANGSSVMDLGGAWDFAYTVSSAEAVPPC